MMGLRSSLCVSRRAALCVAVLAGAAPYPGLSIAASKGPTVLCHYTYGGEEKTLIAHPTRAPYTLDPVAVGSYFQLKVVLQTRPADSAAIKIYVYADREPVPVPIQQMNFPYPPREQAAGYGFTGKHWVYEPIRDGEMQYWCEFKP